MITKNCKGCLAIGSHECNQCRRKTNNASHRDYYYSKVELIHQKARDRGMGIAEKDTGCGGPRNVWPSYTKKELKKLKIKTVKEARKKNKYYPGRDV